MATRHSWTPAPRIVFDLDLDPRDRLDNIQAPLIESSQALLDATLAEIGPVDGLAEAVDARTEGRFRNECETFAHLLDRDWQSIMVANVSYDLALSSFGCSTAAVATPGGATLFRNMDWWPEHLLARASCVVEYRRGGRSVFEAAGWAATFGVVTGMSSRGFAIALNAVGGVDGTDWIGYPVLLYLRRVLEDADGYDHAVELLTTGHLASPGLFTVVGSTAEERIVIERSPTRSATRSPSNQAALIATNDYRALTASRTQENGDLAATSCGRFDALSRLTEGLSRTDYGDEDMLAALTHPEVQMEITAQHVIARPRLGHLRLFLPSRLMANQPHRT